MKIIGALSLALALATPMPVLGAEIVVAGEHHVFAVGNGIPGECTAVTVEETCLER